jgi:hypothetical protein
LGRDDDLISRIPVNIQREEGLGEVEELEFRREFLGDSGSF